MSSSLNFGRHTPRSPLSPRTPHGRIYGIAVVTGANRGVGLDLVRSLINNRRIKRVYAGCRDTEKAELLQALPDPDKKLRLLSLDISKDWSIKSAAESVDKESGRINILINNAATFDRDGEPCGIALASRSAWTNHLNVNLISQAMVTKEFLPLLDTAISFGEGGTIVNMSSKNASLEQSTGPKSSHGNYAYLCSKSALNHLTVLFSKERPDILTVSLCPFNLFGFEENKGIREVKDTTPILLSSLDSMTIQQHSGGFFDYNGVAISY